MKIPHALFGRKADLESVRRASKQGLCCSVVGVSNLGKSALLRTLADSAPSDNDGPTFVYVDCNQMPERTARAFFVAVWHALMDKCVECLASPDLQAQFKQIYSDLLGASSAMNVAVKFQEGLDLALAHLTRPLILCLDEFDEAYQSLEPQTFLNLRALKDRYGDTLAYVTATERELAPLTQSREQGELYELFVPRTHYLHFMEPDDTRLFCESFATREQVTFSADDLAFIQENADGHPGLVQAVCYALGSVTGQPQRDTHQDRVIHRHVQENLGTDENVRSECAKIWSDLEPDERETLLHLQRADVNAVALRSLRNKFIVRGPEEERRVFARLFGDYIRQQKYIQQPAIHGVYVDVDAGAAWINSNPIEGLTDLEYRLLLFLYGRIDRVCDKYSIVETVWGQDYVDKVDDARIEKLVSRVRQKIEPDPAHPRYLLSLRGRGYKLVR